MKHMDSTKTILPYKDETDKSEQPSILFTPRSFNLESEPPQMTEKKQTPFEQQMLKPMILQLSQCHVDSKGQDILDPENLNETQVLNTKRQNLQDNQSLKMHQKQSRLNEQGFNAVQNQKKTKNIINSHKMSQAHTQSNSMNQSNLHNFLLPENMVPSYDVIDLTQDPMQSSQDYEISSDEERIDTFITQEKVRESLQLIRKSYQDLQDLQGIDESVVQDEQEEFQTKDKLKIVNEIPNHRSQMAIESNQNQRIENAYESVNVRDFEISISNRGNQAPLEINNLKTLQQSQNNRVANELFRLKRFPNVVYQCDLTDENEKNDKVEDYDENYQTKMEQQQNKSLMNSVYNRLYVNAQDLQFKQEFQKQFQSQIEKMKYSNIRNTRTTTSYRHSADFDIYNDGPRTHRKTASQSSIKKLYEDYQLRQEKSILVIEEVERKIREDMNKIKSNKNSHNLALLKLEKDLTSILKYMSRKVIPDDKSNLLVPQIFNPLFYEENQRDQKAFQEHIQRQMEELKNKRELTLSKRQLQEFFVITGVLKFINENIAENLNIKQLEKMNYEIEFLDNIWAIINIKYDSEIQNQSQTVEMEFILQLFKIMFDPYTTFEQQTHLIIELRKIIKNIFLKSQIKINDKLEAYLENQDDIQIFIRQTIEDFREMYGNFYNIAHLSNLQYNSNRRSMSPTRRSNSRNGKKYSLLSDEQQCVFKPTTNKKSGQIDPFSKAQFIQQILNQQKNNCNSEDIDEEEESVSNTKSQHKKTINILNSSKISATQQADLNMLNQISIQQNTEQPLFTITATEVAEQTRDRILSVFQITTSQKNKNSPSRQQLLALGFQGSTDDSKQTYIEDITDDQSKTQFNHLHHFGQGTSGSYDFKAKLDRNIILYEQGKMHKQRHQRFSESFREAEERKYTYKPDINKSKSRSPIQFYGSEDSNVNVHERLHQLQVKKEEQKREMQSIMEKSQIAQLKQECPFQPQISQVGYDKEKVKSQTPKGFEKMIQRMKNGQVLKEQKIKDYNNLGQVKNYQGVPTIQTPFELKTQKRDQMRQAKKRKPFIIIEIIISPGKMAHLPIHDGDDPHILCQNFSRTYNLGKLAKDSLLKILTGHLKQHQVERMQRQSLLNKDLENQYGVQDNQESSINKQVRINYDLENLEHSKIIEVSETNESDHTSRVGDKENYL
ncbi:UNKNOWN [Stylonychia lemnae]|uniref:Uncharacterized protein n=1 Tax=Stylonychia lemnae TaxID=5949 RepID=A0A078A601_STYLE|nr:UNKNOWN [Stylonychia lemnae]|eukprot:CDW76985.1 UNKNOWN [Stylonychia lemnae]